MSTSMSAPARSGNPKVLSGNLKAEAAPSRETTPSVQQVDRTPSPERSIAFLPKKLTEYFQLNCQSLVVVGTPSDEIWIEAGTYLAKIRGATQWWLGDWLRYGEHTYATWWIKQTIMRASYTSQPIRFPINAAAEFRIVQKACFELSNGLTRIPTDAEVQRWIRKHAAKYWHSLTTKEIHKIREYPEMGSSLNELVAGSDGEELTELGELHSGPDNVEAENLANLEHEALYEALEALPPKSRQIVSACYGLSGDAPLGPQQISERTGLSRSQVAGVLQEALNTLRRSLAPR